MQRGVTSALRSQRNRRLLQRLFVVAICSFLLVTILQPIVMTPQVLPSLQPSKSPAESPSSTFRFP